ncbi:MAG: hypothetical protein LUG55_02845 [Clostridiales bacterium]|nr:hypothetical protein [Clostridiales bacterium]
MIQTAMPYILLLPAALLAAAALLLGHRLPFARGLAQWLAPVALLLTMLALLLCREQMLPESSHAFWLALGLAGCAGGVAILCAFFPRRGCYLPVLLLGLAGGYIAALGAVQHVGLQATVGCGSYVLVVLLGGMGLTASTPAVQQPDVPTAELPPAEPEALPEGPAAGTLSILAGEYAGNQIQIAQRESLYIGGDGTRCQLVLTLPEMPPCLCRVQWLSQKDTYLVSNYAANGLCYESGLFLPAHGMVEVRGGSQFLFGSEQAPLFRVE